VLKFNDKEAQNKNIENQIKTTKSFHVKEGRSLQLMEHLLCKGFKYKEIKSHAVLH
jgi:hypothetical protein